MKVIILRHGQASRYASSDVERELTLGGRNEVRETVSSLKNYGITKLYASPFRRTQQTADIVSELVSCPVETLGSLIPEGQPQEIVSVLPDQGVVLLVSHMPLVSNLTAYLCDGVSGGGCVFSTAMALVLDMNSPGPGAAKVVQRIPD